MKRFILLFILAGFFIFSLSVSLNFGTKFSFAQDAPCVYPDFEPPPVCTLRATFPSTQSLYVFNNPVKLRAEQDNFHFDGPHPFFLARGSYQVTLQSYDVHVGYCPQWQDKESFYISLRDSAGVLANSGSTPDISDSQNYVTQVVNSRGDSFTIDRNATSITALHPEYPQNCPNEPCNAHSVYPVCALFEYLPPNDDDPPPPPPPATYNIQVRVKEITPTETCSINSGSEVPNVTVRLDSALYPTETKQSPATFNNKASGTYDLSISNYTPGFSVVGGSSRTITINNNTTEVFCLTQTNPWFQTDKGDVRFPLLQNLIPLSQSGSKDLQYPGIFFSSNGVAQKGSGKFSEKGWLVEKEYEYNKTIPDRSGTLSYSFFKSKANKEGVKIDPLPGNIGSGTSNTSISGIGVYEVSGKLNINVLSIGNNSRIVILVNNDIEINGDITVPDGSLLVIAAKGDLDIADDVEEIQGYYSAEGSVDILSNANCNVPGGKDEQLVVQGALVANAKNPFANGGSGEIENSRTLCEDDATLPSLFVETRLNFLTLLTDFYKTTYTKWEEEKP